MLTTSHSTSYSALFWSVNMLGIENKEGYFDAL